MLKDIHPLLNADLLYVLRAMGHGDDLCLCDANFPADSIARQTISRTLVRLDGVNVVEAARAILSVLPLDGFVDAPVRRMEVVDQPDEWPPIHRQMQEVVDAAEDKARPMGSIERFAFYEQAKRSYAVVAASEGRPYGCFLIKKGVILYG